MNRLFRKLRWTKDESHSKSHHTAGSTSLGNNNSTDSDVDEHRAWYETDSDIANSRRQKEHSKAVSRCRTELQDRVTASNGSLPHTHILFLDGGATGGRDVSALTFQNLALHEAERCLQLGQFSNAHIFLATIEAKEHVPATYLFLSQLYNTQGYRSLAANSCRLGLDLIPEPSTLGKDARAHSRFRDLLRMNSFFCNLGDVRTTNSPEESTEACVSLAEKVWDEWLKDTKPAEYGPTQVCLQSTSRRGC